jgi:hypothetical protein
LGPPGGALQCTPSGISVGLVGRASTGPVHDLTWLASFCLPLSLADLDFPPQHPTPHSRGENQFSKTLVGLELHRWVRRNKLHKKWAKRNEGLLQKVDMCEAGRVETRGRARGGSPSTVSHTPHARSRPSNRTKPRSRTWARRALHFGPHPTLL